MAREFNEIRKMGLKHCLRPIFLDLWIWLSVNDRTIQRSPPLRLTERDLNPPIDPLLCAIFSSFFHLYPSTRKKPGKSL